VNVDEKHACNGQPAKEVVSGISEENQVSEWLSALRGCAMAVVPVEELLERKEKSKARATQANVTCGELRTSDAGIM
jgi:hypothetical protein